MAGKCSLENKQVNTIEKTDSLGLPASQSNSSGPAFVIQYFRLKNNPMHIEQPDPMMSNKGFYASEQAAKSSLCSLKRN